MANPTTNFGWVMPTSTDLVTDLPADFAVFGQAVDTSMADLKGGTTGQILSKTTSADMDFTWVAPNAADITGVTAGIGISGGGTSGDVTVTNSMATAIDAKGDLIAGTGADTFSRLAIGTNNQILVADSAQATGMKWATPAAADKTFSLVSSTAFSGSTFTVTGLSGDNLFFQIVGVTNSSASQAFRMRFNTDSSSKYGNASFGYESGASYSANNLQSLSQAPDSFTSIQLGYFSNNTGSTFAGTVMVNGANTSGLKPVQIGGSFGAAGGTGATAYVGGGIYSGTSAISSVSFVVASGSFTAGTLYVYKG